MTEVSVKSPESSSKRAPHSAWIRCIPVALVFFGAFLVVMYTDLPKIARTGTVTLINSYLARPPPASANDTRPETVNHTLPGATTGPTEVKLADPRILNEKFRSLYKNGVPVKPTKNFPTCDKYLSQISPNSRYQLLAMYDPGNCAEIPNAHQRQFETLAVENEGKELLAGPPLFELSDLCSKVEGTVGDPNWRLCYGMPETFHHGKWVHQRYIYGRDYVAAKEKMGLECFDRRVAFFFHLPNLDHQGGPRKVLNNLLSGFRLIGKPYVVNARKLRIFDYLFSPDPHHGFFMYYITEEGLASKFFIGPTVIYTQFDTGRITKATRAKSHIVGASRRALNTNQYFPKIPLDKDNSVVIPTGVDEAIFNPSNKTRTKAFVYVKNGCFESALNQIKSLIKLPIVQIKYGGYTEDQFRTALEETKYGIVCDGAETQGIAIEEMMAMDVPLYVTNPQSVPYFSDEVGVIMPNIEEVASSFQEFVSNVELDVYKPRKWLVENLGMVESAVNTMKVFCGIKNKWNPQMTGTPVGNRMQ